ncbi:sugar phosphate isomerase/epimerase family protein [Yinghuangia sp. YIM S09857]|uniref:sugar phosphate isomerase/epimerase family protein n=1 Tax=Yinghuangia sp. YIM S09857 TaxID=3436929 RepID=UPI003F539634
MSVLCSATLRRADLPTTARAAAAAGFSAISVFVAEYRQARADGWSDAALRDLLDELGLTVAEVDGAMEWLPGHDGFTGHRLFRPEEFAHVAGALGARSITVIEVTGQPVREILDAAAGSYAEVCARAADVGAVAHIEPFGWSGVPDLSAAWEVVERAGHPAGGLLLDTWHALRGPDREGLPAHVPVEAIRGVQVGAAARQPAADLRREAVSARLLPDARDAALCGLLADLLRRGCAAPWGVEVFSDALDRLPPQSVARAAARACERLSKVLAQPMDQ